MMESHIGKLFLILGGFFLLLGLLFLWSPSIPWLGRLPGDIRYEGKNVRFYFPLVTCIVISVLISLLLKILSWWK